MKILDTGTSYLRCYQFKNIFMSTKQNTALFYQHYMGNSSSQKPRYLRQLYLLGKKDFIIFNSVI